MRTLALIVATTSLLFADGGTVLLHQESAPFMVTVFASPTPPRTGLLDLSVLLQTGGTPDPVLDADVAFILTNGSSEIRAQATHDQAQNKMLYAAPVRLDHPGNWRYVVAIRRASPGRSEDGSPPVSLTGTVTVLPEQPRLIAYAGYLALPFVCLAIFALHQWLSRGKRVV